MKLLLNSIQKQKVDFILKNKYSSLTDLNSSEIKNLAVVYCYYSGRIEGNTYTYVETEALLTDGITSEKRYEDAIMLKNLYNTFISEMDYILNRGHKETIDERTLYRVHQSISSRLVSNEESGRLRTRMVRIRGTEYIPPKDVNEIKMKLNEVFYNQNLYENPLEKAIYLHCNIAKIQPFIDGNKRTSRMIESIVLMNDNLIPVYSIRDSDLLHYRRSLVSFYETGDYTEYINYFLNQQIRRINELSLQDDDIFDLITNRIVHRDNDMQR